MCQAETFRIGLLGVLNPKPAPICHLPYPFTIEPQSRRMAHTLSTPLRDNWEHRWACGPSLEPGIHEHSPVGSIYWQSKPKAANPPVHTDSSAQTPSNGITNFWRLNL